jgi:hypothetical protein
MKQKKEQAKKEKKLKRKIARNDEKTLATDEK